MPRAMNIVGLVLLMLLSAAAGFMFHQSQSTQAPNQADQIKIDDKSIIGQRRPEFQLNDLNGEVRNITEWDGKLLVVNFWATWCPPCREEIPEFMELQTELAAQGVQFLGVALENAEDVLPFYQELGMNYPSLVGQQAVIKLAKQFGNDIGALPYTVIIDKNGVIRATQRGPISQQEARQRILSYL